ncbi:MAG: ABC transporter permease [Solirubrobacterales bacterium]|nr:ABC transporter permease [Solirubrobacterales bacterium]
MSAHLRVAWALVRRGLNEILRVPGGAIPGVLAPTIFMLGLSAVFAEAARLPGFTAEDFRTFIVPVGMLQGAGFTGAATGVNLARDIERGWFDRLLLAPVPRPIVLAGVVASACLRALLPASFLLVVALALGVDWPGLLGLVLATMLVMGFAAISACWGVVIALRFRSQQAAPLMQVATFASVLFTTAYQPKGNLAPWLETIATANPVTLLLEGVRQGFVGELSWATTVAALAATAGLLLALGALAVRGMVRQGH